MADSGNSEPRQPEVRFVLDGRTIELHDVDPTRTVLQWLREDEGRTGTKEGCAEGDCGACTVAVLDIDAAGKPVLRAINACIQFLPTLDGKELFTVESLKGADGSLHPVQQALVEQHGSQCGFCTPGFVMSLFALYKTHAQPTRAEIDDALAGNLCRCTGYRPIVEAAQQLFAAGAPVAGTDWMQSGCDPQDAAGLTERAAALRDLRQNPATSVEHAGRVFHAPQSLAALADLLMAHPEATLLAGGTDVGLWVTKQHRELDTVIYTGRVPELLGIDESDGELTLGAAVTVSDAMPVLVQHFPELEELFLRYGSPPIRNAATLGGNVANGSPIGDSMPALIALGASLTLRRGAQERRLPLDEFYLGYQQTALDSGEFVQGIHLPLEAADERPDFRCYKVSKRFDQDISAVCAAFSLRLAGDEILKARVAFGGMAAIPSRAPGCEAALNGKPFAEATIELAAAALAGDFQPISDARASEGYRMQVCQNLLRRCYLEISSGQALGVYHYGRR